MIYNSLLLHIHINCSLLSWGANCGSIELLQGSSSYKFQISSCSHGADVAESDCNTSDMDHPKFPDMYATLYVSSDQMIEIVQKQGSYLL